MDTASFAGNLGTEGSGVKGRGGNTAVRIPATLLSSISSVSVAGFKRSNSLLSPTLYNSSLEGTDLQRKSVEELVVQKGVS